ncbi:hypothetical protein ElyMa_003933800 [Elysia marginata]|uniref:Condensation domain-containing protein n=1 Tax=Elysia marginata TaxID=1093978 RepID=A0AAV4FR87_9GAST|nr:hypothetical protein ElyMa_003933800 [Elysia marginata]
MDSQFLQPFFSVSKHIRALKKQQAKEQKTTNRLDLSNESAMKLAPVDLYNMLSWIMSDSDELDKFGRVQVNESVKQKALSISQDIMSASARMNMPKNTALALHVLKQTRSKDTVIMLNRFGHTISYDDAQRHITKEADKVDENIAKEGIFIPPDLKEGRFTQVAFDNLDFSDVQKDGSSFHATTHVIYQYKKESQSPVKSDVSTQRGRRKSCQTSEAFYTKKSNLTIQDRRAARSVNQALPDDDLEHAAIIYEFEDEIGVWLALKISHFVADGMLSAQWIAFEAEMKSSKINRALEKLSILLPKIKDVGFFHRANAQPQNETTMECKGLLQEVKSEWKLFQESLGVTAKFWMMYIQMVLILRRYIHAERCGNWHGHLIEVRRMLPYLITAGHRKYASCVPIYLKHMEELPDRYPGLYAAFLKGNFTVHHTSGFHNGVWTDMAIDQSYNKEGKTTLFKGIIQSARTRDKYIKTVPYMSSVSHCAKSMANMLSKCERKKRDDSQSSKNVLEEIELRNMNPFTMDDKESLVNIVTGIILPEQTMLQAREFGEAAIEMAKEKNSAAIEIPKIMNFKQLEEIGKKSKLQASAQTPQVENKAIRAMCLARSAWPLHTQSETFKYEWTPYPLSLF